MAPANEGFDGENPQSIDGNNGLIIKFELVVLDGLSQVFLAGATGLDLLGERVLEKGEAIAASALGVIEREIGAAHEHFAIGGVARADADADRRADVNFLPVAYEWLAHALQQSFGEHLAIAR